MDRDTTITMPGGQLRISIDDQGEIRMRGPVEEICSGDFSPDLLRLLTPHLRSPLATQKSRST